MDRSRKGFPHVVFMRLPRNLTVHFFQFSTKYRIRLFPPRKPNDRRSRRHFSIHGDVVKSWHQLAVGKIAGGTKYHNGAWGRTLTGHKVFSKWVHREWRWRILPHPIRRATHIQSAPMNSQRAIYEFYALHPPKSESNPLPVSQSTVALVVLQAASAFDGTKSSGARAIGRILDSSQRICMDILTSSH